MPFEEHKSGMSHVKLNKSGWESYCMDSLQCGSQRTKPKSKNRRKCDRKKVTDFVKNK